MSSHLTLPAFGKFTDKLNASGVETRNARGFWGGVGVDGTIVVTAWLDGHDEAGRFYIWRPKTNHGGLRTMWEVGNMRVGTEVTLILVQQRGTVPHGKPGRSVAGAALMPTPWRIVDVVTGKKQGAWIERVPVARRSR
jgi:hypothetical protein